MLYRLVTDIPEEAWADVEILGWMYQFYNSAVKAEFFKSKRKAGAEDIAPATQLFTPDWIVRYMVDNALGRLWMLNRPESTLRDYARAENPSDRLMEYYIEPDEEHEDFIRLTSPEDITFCDPACGSGHILVYAFKMLMAIYQECGYREREIPALILARNLSGFEIDRRAAQIAQLALAMCARAYDRRFFTRSITANICVLSNIDIDVDELSLTSPLRNKEQLLQDLAHLGEIGSLMQPTSEDIAALENDLAESNTGDLFSSKANEHVGQALAACRALTRRFDVVVANPPYMGSNSFNPFMSKWMKKHYPNSCKDLCTAFIERELSMQQQDGYSGMITSDTCMYLSSFERLRNEIINDATIISLIDTRGTNAHPDVFDANTGWVITKSRKPGFKGAYFKLNQRIGEKADALLEAIQNPDCGWFYRADSERFHDIPGAPIAYWTSEASRNAFRQDLALSKVSALKQGMKTADNDRFLRLWFEPSYEKTGCAQVGSTSRNGGTYWTPYLKGGEYRKWYGNYEYVLNWSEDGAELRRSKKAVLRNIAHSFKPGLNWTVISSGRLALRATPAGFMFDGTGSAIFPNHAETGFAIIAFLIF